MATTETLVVEQGERGLRALLQRALALQDDAYARFQRVGEHDVDVFVTTPFDCVASRRVRGTVSRDGAVVPARRVLEALETSTGALGAAQDQNWPGALPPAQGFVLREEVPISTARQLADEGRNLARQFAGPLGPPVSLLDAVVITVDADDRGPKLEIPMRAVFTCTSLGLIPGFEAPVEVPRYLRVSSAGRWVRIDAPFGTVYHSKSLSLFV
ncbi:hypothetical protein [Corynebacterium pseudogenitalium]|uniref:hypothetical protein n=1 Tax=Corynebacterium pseudogenitalium TaxID=38303 RepID=UPI00210EA4C1|nr:hypothetical protein [Corynebacterium pseudogenitalium]